MLDFHCHILPGVDDGAETLEEAIAMLDTAKAAGITVMVATPHMKSPRHLEEQGKRVQDAYALLVPYAEERGIQLHLGCEFYAPLLHDVELELLPKFCIRGTNRLLLEFHPGHVPHHLSSYCNDMLIRNIVPVIAHPERYGVVQEKPEILQDVVSLGVGLQINGRSMNANPFDKISNTAKKLLKLYPTAFLSSDAHEVSHYAGLVKAQSKWNRMRKDLP